MAANPISQTINAAALTGGYSAPFAFDWRNGPINTTISVILVGGTTATYTLQFTLDDINQISPLPTFTTATANWENDPDLNSLTTSGVKSLLNPYLYGRLSVPSLSAGGSLLLRVVQGGAGVV